MHITQQWNEWTHAHDRRSFWDQIGHAAAIAIAFTIPITTALTTVLSLVILGAWVLGPHRDEKWHILCTHPLLKWVYLLIGLAGIGALYTEADPRALRHGFSDALRFALIPLLLYFYQSEKIAKAALWAFVGAMVVTLLLAYLKVYADFPIGLKYTTGAVFKSHIKTSYFMAIAAFILAVEFPRFQRYRWVAALVIASMVYYVFFMNIGRIGYLTLMLGGILIAWQTYRWKGIAYGAAIGTIVILGAYGFSDLFHQRVHLLSQDLAIYQQGGLLVNSSLGSRISFILDSVSLMKVHPWLGYGTGSFGAAYATLPESAHRLFTDNPHNEFLRMGVEFGVLGVAILIAFFYQQWRLSQSWDQRQGQIWQGLFLTFVMGCCMNSWIKDHTEGYFYCVMTAVFFSQISLKAAVARERLAVVH